MKIEIKKVFVSFLLLIVLFFTVSCNGDAINKVFSDKEQPKKEFTVSFDLNGIGGTTPTSQKVFEGDKANKPEVTADGGYVVSGWYQDKELLKLWDFNEPVNSDLLLYAKWQKSIDSILPVGFPTTPSDWKTSETNAKYCYKDNDGNLVFEDTVGNQICISITKLASKNDTGFVFEEDGFKIKFLLLDNKLSSISVSGSQDFNGTYQETSCIAAGTKILMADGSQKPVEEIEVGDFVSTFNHETGNLSSAPVCFIWESKNVSNTFTLTFENNIEITVVEEHGFYDKEEKKYVFINSGNAMDYIGHHFYNAEIQGWVALQSYEVEPRITDAYSIITSGHLNHMANGILSISDGTIELLANIFEYDDQMKIDAQKKEQDIEKYGLTSKEVMLEFDGFIDSDYEDYNLQYLNVMIGKGLTTWESIQAISDYCLTNGL